MIAKNKKQKPDPIRSKKPAKRAKKNINTQDE